MIEQVFYEMQRDEPALWDKPEHYKNLIQKSWARTGSSALIQPDAKAVMAAIGGSASVKLVDTENARQMVTTVLSNFAENGSAESIAALINFLHPYAKGAGYCMPYGKDSGDDVCSYGIGQSMFTVSSLVHDAGKNFVFKPDLAALSLDAAFPAPVSIGELQFKYITTPIDSSSALASTNSTGIGETGGASSKKGRTCSNRKGTFDCYVAFTYRHKSGWSSDKLWAEAIGSGTLKPPYTVVSDNIMLNLPIVQRCGWSCRLETIGNCLDDLASGGLEKALLCAASNTSKENWEIHSGGSYIQHIHERACNIQRNRPENREYFNNYQAGRYDSQYNVSVPEEYKQFLAAGDLRFQTNYQVPPLNQAHADQGANIYPKPTETQLNALVDAIVIPPVGQPRWTHRFSVMRGWKFNILFGASDAFPTPLAENCWANMQHPSRPELTVMGNQFHVFHGTASGDFPAWDLIIGWNGQKRPAL